MAERSCVILLVLYFRKSKRNQMGEGEKMLGRMKQRGSRILSVCLATALVLGSLGVFPMPKTKAAGENLIQNPNFAEEDMSMWLDTGATIARGSQDEEIVSGVKTFATISGRSETYQGFSQDVTDKVEEGAEYEISFWVKLSEEYQNLSGGERTVFFGPHLVVDGETQYLSQAYSSKITGSLLAECPAGKWTQLSGTFEIPEGTTKVVVRFQEEGSKAKGAYSITGVSMTKKAQAATTQKQVNDDYDGPRLRDAITEALGEDTIVGMVTHPINNKKEWAVLTTHANAVTAGNELKPDAHFGYSNAKVPGTETITFNGKQLVVPKIDYSRGNQFLDGVLKYNNEHPDTPIRMRGHVLVWHSQTPEWFFHVDYDANKDYVSKDVMTQRQEWYIKSILTHYLGEDSKYKDLFYGWDVVNEAVSDGGSQVYRDESGNSSWWKVYQSNEFIINAFKFANKYAPANVELYYNDYGDASPTKSDKICQLIRDVKAQEGAPGVGTRIDAFGMQAHYGMNDFSIENFEAAARKYLDLLGKVQLTELDMAASSNYDGTAATQEQEYLDQAVVYMQIFETLKKLEQVDGYDITGITFWGVTDPTSWLQSRSTVGGGQDGTRKQVPLLFDGDYQPKPAFWAFVDPSRIEISRKQVEVRRFYGGSEKEVWTTFGGGRLAGIVKPFWNEEGITLKVTVTDASNDGAGDFLTVYLDEENQAQAGVKPKVIKVLRTECESYNGGYDAEIKLPVTELSMGKKIGLDIVLTSGEGKQVYLNDILGKQEISTANYAELILKPGQGSITQGTVTVDGEAEDVWKTANTFWLNMNDGEAKAGAKVKALWDEAKLYVYAQVQDEKMHGQDALEIYLDEKHDSVCYQEKEDQLIRIDLEGQVTCEGKNADAKAVEAKVKRFGNGYVIEAAIPWSEFTAKVYGQLGLEWKLKDYAETGKLLGTLNWFDESGEDAETAFGLASLAAAGKEKEDAENPDAKFSKAGAFTGLTEEGDKTQQGTQAGNEENDTEPATGASDGQGAKEGLITLCVAIVVGLGAFGFWRSKKATKEKTSEKKDSEKK